MVEMVEMVETLWVAIVVMALWVAMPLWVAMVVSKLLGRNVNVVA